MKRICKRASDGGVIVKGNHYNSCVGSRAEVGHKSAYKTSGGLTKSDIIKNKHGRWVSKRLSQIAKKEKRLEKAGYRTKKGKFGSFRVKSTDSKTRKRKTRKSRK
jgi:hypothetical protein